jgi:hypothetical protein
MSRAEIHADVMDRAEHLAEKLEVIEKSGPYVNAMQAMGQFQKDNFEMIDRTLSMMQAVHRVELQNTSFYVDILKFLIPIFATAAIAGATLDTQGINSTLLVTIGLIGIIGGALTLAPLLIKRHKKTKEQSNQYAKLAKALENWQKVAKLREQMSMDDNFNSEEAKRLLEDVMKFANLASEIEK